MKFVLVFLNSFFSIISSAQTDSVAYTHDYEFNEGFFLNLNQFKKNNPLLKTAIITAIPKEELDFYTQAIEEKMLVYKDSTGKQQQLETKMVWGYCQNRNLYVNFNNTFNRINTIGTWCHFTSMITTNLGNHDPFNSSYGINTTVKELHQFILDTQTNKVFDFSVKDMELLLKKDPDLYKEFMTLSNRNKSKTLFVYLRKYNEKHPLYLPVIP